jgi:dynactin complex subunit
MFEEIADENKALHEKISQQNQENDELKALMDSLNGKHEISDFSLSDALKALQKMTEKVFFLSLADVI